MLVIEDAEPIRVAVSAALTARGFRPVTAADGAGLEGLLDAHQPHVVVLDLMLPGRGGLELLDVVRARSTAGVLLLTARDSTADRVDGLTRGADDYLVKPFAMPELLARVAAIARRTGGRVPVTVVGDLEVTIDGDGLVHAQRSGVDLELTGTEAKLLRYLAERVGRTLNKTQLLTGVWGYEGFDPNVVEVHVSALRRKMEAHGPRLIHTVRGHGYRLADEQ